MRLRADRIGIADFGNASGPGLSGIASRTFSGALLVLMALACCRGQSALAADSLHAVEPRLSWRLDGTSSDPERTLLLCVHIAPAEWSAQGTAEFRVPRDIPDGNVQRGRIPFSVRGDTLYVSVKVVGNGQRAFPFDAQLLIHDRYDYPVTLAGKFTIPILASPDPSPLPVSVQGRPSSPTAVLALRPTIDPQLVADGSMARVRVITTGWTASRSAPSDLSLGSGGGVRALEINIDRPPRAMRDYLLVPSQGGTVAVELSVTDRRGRSLVFRSDPVAVSPQRTVWLPYLLLLCLSGAALIWVVARRRGVPHSARRARRGPHPVEQSELVPPVFILPETVPEIRFPHSTRVDEDIAVRPDVIVRPPKPPAPDVRVEPEIPTRHDVESRPAEAATRSDGPAIRAFAGALNSVTETKSRKTERSRHRPREIPGSVVASSIAPDAPSPPLPVVRDEPPVPDLIPPVDGPAAALGRPEAQEEPEIPIDQALLELVNAALGSCEWSGTGWEVTSAVTRGRQFLDSRDAVSEALRAAGRRERAEIVHVLVMGFHDRNVKIEGVEIHRGVKVFADETQPTVCPGCPENLLSHELPQLFMLLELEDESHAFLVPPSFGEYLAPRFPKGYRKLLKNDVEDGIVRRIIQPATLRESVLTHGKLYVVNHRMELEIRT